MDTIVLGTWGLTGPQFLILYAVGFVTTCVVFERRRRRIASPPTGDTPSIDELDPCEIAFVAHGEQDARVIALLDLEREGALGIDNASARSIVQAEPDAAQASSHRAARREQKDWIAQVKQESEVAGHATTLVADEDDLPGGACALEQQIVAIARRHGECTLETLTNDSSLAESERALRESLVERGFLLHDDHVEQLRRARWVWAPLVALGAARLLTGLAAGRPVGILVLALGATVWFACSRRIPTAPRGVEQQLSAAVTDERRADVERAFGTDATQPPDRFDLTALALVGVVTLWSFTSPYAVALAVPQPASSGGWFGDGCAGCGGCGCGGCA